MTDVQLCLDYGLTTAERFERFHDENPIVFIVLVRLAREWVKRTGAAQGRTGRSA